MIYSKPGVEKPREGEGSRRRKGKTRSCGLLISLGLDQHWQAVNIHLCWALHDLELVLGKHQASHELSDKRLLCPAALPRCVPRAHNTTAPTAASVTQDSQQKQNHVQNAKVRDGFSSWSYTRI